MFAQVFYFTEWSSWAVTLYTPEDDRAVDADGRVIEAEWFHLKSEAVHRAEELLNARMIDRYETFTRDGRHERTVARLRRTGEIKETSFP